MVCSKFTVIWMVWWDVTVVWIASSVLTVIWTVCPRVTVFWMIWAEVTLVLMVCSEVSVVSMVWPEVTVVFGLIGVFKVHCTLNVLSKVSFVCNYLDGLMRCHCSLPDLLWSNRYVQRSLYSEWSVRGQLCLAEQSCLIRVSCNLDGLSRSHCNLDGLCTVHS